MLEQQPRRSPADVENGEGPRGARWFVGLLYVFMAVVLAGWAAGWWDRGVGTGTASRHTSGAATTGSGSTGEGSSR